MSKYILQTRSIESRTKQSDGIRVCVMRRIKPEYKFDIWMPILGPSTALLNSYVVKKNISWITFSKTYTKQLLRKKFFLRLILLMLSKSTVTLLCVEKKANQCHRFLLASEIKKLNTEVGVKHL